MGEEKKYVYRRILLAEDPTLTARTRNIGYHRHDHRHDHRPSAGRSPGNTTQELLADFQRTLVLASSREHAKMTVQVVRRYIWQCAVAHDWQVTARTIETYLGGLAERGRAPKTLQNHLTALSGFCRFLVARGLLARNPCTEIRLRKPDEQLPRYLDQAEIDQVMRIARAEGIYPEVCLALSTGLRLGELMRLRWPDIDFAHRKLAVRKSKSHRPRVVPLSDSAMAALTMQRRVAGSFEFVFPARQTWRGGWRYVDRLRAKPWWLRALKPIQEAVPKFRDLPGCSTGRGWHIFRHTFASRAAQRGVSLYKIAAWLGHSDVRTTRMYAHLQIQYDEDIESASPLGMVAGSQGPVAGKGV